MQLKWTERYKLDENHVSKINQVSGVYKLIYLDESSKYIVYYVGQAEDLNSRLNQHLPNNETNTCCNKFLNQYGCYFRAAGVSKQSDRDGAEVALYNRLVA